MDHRSVLGCLSATALLTSLAACSGGDDAGGQPGDDTFVIALPSSPHNLDPHGPNSISGSAYQLKRLLYDALVNADREGKPVPGVADRWTVAGAKVTLHVRPGVTCSDGSPVTAGTVAANLKYVLDPTNASPQLGASLPRGLTVTATDAGAGTVTVDSPIAPEFLLHQLSEFAIVCDAGMKDRKSLANGAAGTGPYTLAGAVPDSEYKLNRRDGYSWGAPGAPDGSPPAKVDVRVIDNQTTTANLLLAKQVNAAQVTSIDEATRLTKSGLTARTARQSVGQLYFNQRSGHVTVDEKLRTAIMHAVDLAQVSKVATSGTGVPSKGMTREPYACGGVDPRGAAPAFDKTRAESALTAAGWTRSGQGWSKAGKPLKVTFLYWTSFSPEIQSGVQLITRFWRDAGIEVVPKGVNDISAVLLKTGDWDVFWGQTNVDVPTQLLPFFAGQEPPGGINFTGSKNAAYRALAGPASSRESDCGKWNAAEMSLYTSTSMVPMDDVQVPVFAQNATFEVSGIGAPVLAATIRMT